MLGTLIESKRPQERRVARHSLSFAIHVALGLGAIHATASRAAPDDDQVRVEPLFFSLPAEQPTPRPTAPAVAPAPRSQTPPSQPPIAVPVPVPTTVPISVEPMEPGPAVDPRRFAIVPAAGCEACRSASPPVSTTLFTDATVDRAVLVIEQQAPVYPAVLVAAGLEGRVTVQFVVDSTGRVEPESIRVVAASHPAFGESARRAIASSRFRPARVRGQPVRQLVQQAMRFAIGR